MSGGSYNYLARKVDGDLFANAPGFDDLEQMAARLEGLDWATDVASETRSLIDRAKQIDLELKRFSNVFHAVEWWDSCDWVEDQVRSALADYRESVSRHPTEEETE